MQITKRSSSSSSRHEAARKSFDRQDLYSSGVYQDALSDTSEPPLHEYVDNTVIEYAEMDSTPMHPVYRIRLALYGTEGFLTTGDRVTRGSERGPIEEAHLIHDVAEHAERALPQLISPGAIIFKNRYENSISTIRQMINESGMMNFQAGDAPVFSRADRTRIRSLARAALGAYRDLRLWYYDQDE